MDWQLSFLRMFCSVLSWLLGLSYWQSWVSNICLLWLCIWGALFIFGLKFSKWVEPKSISSLSSVIDRVSVVLKTTVTLVTVTDVSTTWAVMILKVKVTLYRQWMVFMSLVVDLIGQLNCHVIGCKTRKSWLVRFDPSIVPVSLLLVKLSVQSIVCLFWRR